MARATAPQETEALPEADRLDGFAHPRETARLFGHERAERNEPSGVQLELHSSILLGEIRQMQFPQGIARCPQLQCAAAKRLDRSLLDIRDLATGSE